MWIPCCPVASHGFLGHQIQQNSVAAAENESHQSVGMWGWSERFGFSNEDLGWFEAQVVQVVLKLWCTSLSLLTFVSVLQWQSEIADLGRREEAFRREFGYEAVLHAASYYMWWIVVRFKPSHITFSLFCVKNHSHVLIALQNVSEFVWTSSPDTQRAGASFWICIVPSCCQLWAVFSLLEEKGWESNKEA